MSSRGIQILALVVLSVRVVFFSLRVFTVGMPLCLLFVVEFSWRNWSMLWLLIMLLSLTSSSVLSTLESKILGALIESLLGIWVNTRSVFGHLRLLELIVYTTTEVTVLQIIEFWNTSQNVIILRFITAFVNRFLFLILL